MPGGVGGILSGGTLSSFRPVTLTPGWAVYRCGPMKIIPAHPPYSHPMFRDVIESVEPVSRVANESSPWLGRLIGGAVIMCGSSLSGCQDELVEGIGSVMGAGGVIALSLGFLMLLGVSLGLGRRIERIKARVRSDEIPSKHWLPKHATDEEKVQGIRDHCFGLGRVKRLLDGEPELARHALIAYIRHLYDEAEGEISDMQTRPEERRKKIEYLVRMRIADKFNDGDFPFSEHFDREVLDQLITKQLNRISLFGQGEGV